MSHEQAGPIVLYQPGRQRRVLQMMRVCRAVGTGVHGGHHILTDQLTLSQPGGGRLCPSYYREVVPLGANGAMAPPGFGRSVGGGQFMPIR